MWHAAELGTFLHVRAVLYAVLLHEAAISCQVKVEDCTADWAAY